MPKHPGDLIPPDDTGSTTFQRFRYQAHVAFPYMLSCGLGGDVVSVAFEHIEDVVLECRDRWRFLQIKTRDPERGPWRLRDLTVEHGALHALNRSYNTVKDLPIATTHEIFLEGAAHRADTIQLLATAEGRGDSALVGNVARALNVDVTEAGAFLQRVRLKMNLPSRSAIAATNLRSLTSQAPHLPAGTLQNIYEAVIKLADDAMAADLRPIPWSDIRCDPDDVDGAARSLFDAKRLTREMIVSLLGPITGAVRPLLRRWVDADGKPPTALEQKLLAGGATPEIVRHAQGLRAQATILALEHAAATFGDEGDYLEDISERLLAIVDGLRAAHATTPRPAPLIWNRLLTQLPNLLETVDQRQVFRRDAYMLLGHVCELADQCHTDWGTTDA